MVKDAEALNETREELERKTTLKLKQEQASRELLMRPPGSKPGKAGAKDDGCSVM